MGESRPPAASHGVAISTGRAAAAIVAGWLIPGAGHALLGRMRRAVFFFLLIGASFTLGLAHDGRLALYNSREAFLSGLQVVANVGVGPADAVARLAVYGGIDYRLPDQSEAARAPLETTFRNRQRSAVAAYGTAYLWTAGLMNLLLLLDVWDIATGRKD